MRGTRGSARGRLLIQTESGVLFYTTPWTIFLYTNNHLRRTTRLFQNNFVILVVRPAVVSSANVLRAGNFSNQPGANFGRGLRFA